MSLALPFVEGMAASSLLRERLTGESERGEESLAVANTV